jgi:predicted nucleic acid-binding protein
LIGRLQKFAPTNTYLRHDPRRTRQQHRCECAYHEGAIAAINHLPDDDMFFATALLGQADYIVSGDKKHLLNNGVYEGIRIITARQFGAEVLDAEK